MGAKVVDASAMAAVLFAEPEGAMVAARLDGSDLVAPTLLPHEMANVAVIKLRRHPTEHAAIIGAVALFARLEIDLRPVDLEDVVALAQATNLTAYDASYLWLARQRSLELVTLDRALTRAAAG